jgi:hypothetical protein
MNTKVSNALPALGSPGCTAYSRQMMIFEDLRTLAGEELEAAALDGRPAARFRPTVEPEADELIAAIEAELPS